MHIKSFFGKTLAFIVIVALISMRLGTWSEDAFAIPVQDAIFHIAFIAADAQPVSTKALKVTAKQCLDFILLPSGPVSPLVQQPQLFLLPAVCSLIVKDISAEIFIPPEGVS